MAPEDVHELAGDLVYEARSARTRESEDLAAQLGWDPEWIEQHCQGDGFWHHPLLAAPGPFVSERSVTMSGEIRDGRGYHPMATFCWERKAVG